MDIKYSNRQEPDDVYEREAIVCENCGEEITEQDCKEFEGLCEQCYDKLLKDREEEAGRVRDESNLHPIMAKICNSIFGV